jgi:hypothetical protein
MPAYKQSTALLPITALYPGASVDVFSAETVTSGERSQALALSNYPLGSGNPISLDLVFSGAPGAFSFNITFAAKDVAADYAVPLATETPLTTWTVTQAMLDSVNNAVHVDLPYVNARFVSLYVTSAPANSVTVTATLKR